MTAQKEDRSEAAQICSALEALKAKPLIDTMRSATCCSCGSCLREQVGRGHDFEYETCGNVWTMWRCTECGHLQLDPRPADHTLRIIYPPNYYSYQMNQQVSALALWAKRQLDRRKFRYLLRKVGRSPSSFLDVGCGDGRYLQLMLDMGLASERVSGLELDERAVNAARQAGLNVCRCRAEDADHVPPNSIDLITMFHVIEHLAQPKEVIRSLVTMLSPGGCLAIETPNFESLDARLFGKGYWGGYHFPRHWHIFTPASLQRVLEAEGLKVLAIKYQTGHAFWTFSFHHSLKYREPDPWPRLAAWTHPFGGIVPLAAVTAFDSMRGLLGSKTSAMLVIARKVA